MVLCFAACCNHRTVRNKCSFYRFPKNEWKHELWTIRSRRADRIPGSDSRLCSCHFKDGKKENDPTVFHYTKTEAFPQEKKPSQKKKKIKFGGSPAFRHKSYIENKTSDCFIKQIQQKDPIVLYLNTKSYSSTSDGICSTPDNLEVNSHRDSSVVGKVANLQSKVGLLEAENKIKFGGSPAFRPKSYIENKTSNCFIKQIQQKDEIVLSLDTKSYSSTSDGICCTPDDLEVKSHRDYSLVGKVAFLKSKLGLLEAENSELKEKCKDMLTTQAKLTKELQSNKQIISRISAALGVIFTPAEMKLLLNPEGRWSLENIESAIPKSEPE